LASVGKPLNKKKAAALFDQARLQLAQGKVSEAEVALKTLVDESELRSPTVFVALAQAQAQQRLYSNAEQTLRAALDEFPGDPHLSAELGATLVQLGQLEQGVALLESAKKKRPRDGQVLTRVGFGMLGAGRLDEAEQAASAAVRSGGGSDAQLLLASILGKQGRYAEAERLAKQVEAQARKDPRAAATARSIRADSRLSLGDGAGALAIWKEQRDRGELDPSQLGHMAYAAQLAGETAVCDELIANASNPSAEDSLLFAQIAVLRSQPRRALELLMESESAAGERYSGFEFEVGACRGRALRQLGRRDEAKAALQEALALEEGKDRRFGPTAHVALAQLLRDEGDEPGAVAQLRAALALDPEHPEAKLALRADEQEPPDAPEARAAEAEALHRRFRARESEVAHLARELAKAKAAARDAEEKAARAEQEARAATELARELQQEKVREELIARELEAEEKATENIERALAPVLASCPTAVRLLLQVAERTFQKALFTDLPAAAVAVLYSGALERALFVFFVERFQDWLRVGDRRERFLRGAVRERRGSRVEYFDYFVEAFDEERAGKAPSMGEVGRALEKRHEPYMAPFRKFLEETYAVDDAFFEKLAAFVRWGKEKLRDPAAHGRGIELGYDELKRFREQLLFDLDGQGAGALAMLLRKS
jgi:tetratricopeptide (TPR) repeat protein